MKGRKGPSPLAEFKKRHGDAWEAFEEMEDAVDDGPIDEKNRELIKTAVSAATGQEMGTGLHAERAIEAGATEEEVRQSVLLTANIAGFPAALQGSFSIDKALD